MFNSSKLHDQLVSFERVLLLLAYSLGKAKSSMLNWKPIRATVWKKFLPALVGNKSATA